MKITTIICTWNRARSLDKALCGLKSVVLPPDLNWEILVVNNNCKDDTSEVVKSYEGSLPIREVIESKQGLSNARNRGISEADGDLILWTDDDVLVDSLWLKSYYDAFLDNPSVAFFGGPVRPNFIGKTPAWIENNWRCFQGAYALLDPDREVGYFDRTIMPFGANFAVRREVQEEFQFDPKMGRNGGVLLSGEETAVMTGIMEAGYDGLWVPGAGVYHIIDEGRQNIQYLRKYYYWSGRTRVRNGVGIDRDGAGGEGRSVFGVPLWLMRMALRNELRFQLGKIWREESLERWIESLKDGSSCWGMIRERMIRSD